MILLEQYATHSATALLREVLHYIAGRGALLLYKSGIALELQVEHSARAVLYKSGAHSLRKFSSATRLSDFKLQSDPPLWKTSIETRLSGTESNFRRWHHLPPAQIAPLCLQQSIPTSYLQLLLNFMLQGPIK